jgi:pimeloyl-ACP methyl ester carboxylesterase
MGTQNLISGWREQYAGWRSRRAQRRFLSSGPVDGAPLPANEFPRQVSSAHPSRLLRSRGFWTGAILATALLFGASQIYKRPTWVLDQVERVHLKLAGVEGYSVYVHGHRLHYYVSGQPGGEPVVLLHGLGGRSEDWIRMLPYLQQAGYRVYTPDLLGFGQSDEPHNASYSIQEQARLVVGFMDKVGLERVDLGGWSMGGWIAQKVAVDNPERVRRLVLMDSAGLKVPPKWDTKIFTPTTPDELNQLHAMLTPDPKPMPKFVVEDMLRLSRDYGWVVKKALASMMTANDVMDADLPSLKMPVLILWGDQDRITPLSEGQTMHTLIPGSWFHVASGCGHVAPASCVDQLGPALTSFLKNAPSTNTSQTNILRANYETDKKSSAERNGE